MVISVSTADTASIRHERTGRPSTSTVHAPQTPCSQPTWVPVRPQSWRSASESSRRAGTRTAWVAPFTCRTTSCRSSLIGLTAASRAARSTRSVSTRTSSAR